MTLILVVITVLIILLIFSQKKIVEGYDARYINTDLKDCADFCKKTSNCYGFGYDPKNSICYPSQYPILGRPIYSLFKNEYSYYNTTCNKINAILEPKTNPSFEARRSNSIYVCSESKDKQPQFYFYNRGNFENIGEGRNIDDIFDVEDYEVNPYTWPRNEFDCDQLDLLQKERENQTFTPQNVTDIDRIIAIPKEQNSHEITVNDNSTNISMNEASIVYKKTDKVNSGEYLRNYKCVKNIPMQDCLRYCTKDQMCKGVEWNPLFNNSFDVCCPYRTVDGFIERTADKSLGRFYEKQTK
jgi:hypothetical protein